MQKPPPGAQMQSWAALRGLLDSSALLCISMCPWLLFIPLARSLLLRCLSSRLLQLPPDDAPDHPFWLLESKSSDRLEDFPYHLRSPSLPYHAQPPSRRQLPHRCLWPDSRLSCPVQRRGTGEAAEIGQLRASQSSAWGLGLGWAGHGPGAALSLAALSLADLSLVAPSLAALSLAAPSLAVLSHLLLSHLLLSLIGYSLSLAAL